MNQVDCFPWVQQKKVNELPLEQLVAMVLRHHKTPAALASAIVQSLSDIQNSTEAFKGPDISLRSA